MGTKLSDLQDYFDPGLSVTVWGSKYPKPGKEYTVPLPTAEVGLWCRGMLVTGGSMAGLDENATDDDLRAVAARLDELKMPDGMEELTLPQIVLGAAYAQMVADGVYDQLVEFAGTTAYLWIALGEEVAERWWQSGGRPEAARPAANRAEKRAQSKARGTGATSTAAANTTRSRASTSSTTTPKKSVPVTAAKRSRGRTS